MALRDAAMRQYFPGSIDRLRKCLGSCNVAAFALSVTPKEAVRHG